MCVGACVRHQTGTRQRGTVGVTTNDAWRAPAMSCVRLKCTSHQLLVVSQSTATVCHAATSQQQQQH
jgi:hypothetical protein